MPDTPPPPAPLPPLASLLVCPLTHAPLTPDPSGDFLITPTGIRYPIQNGIPILLPSAAIMPTDSQSSHLAP